MKQKLNRLQAIIDIVSTMEICGQEEMLKELSKRGFDLTQATLSRNLKELGIAKITNSDGRYHYAKHIKEAPIRILDRHNFSFIGYKSLVFSGQLGIIKTNAGYASMIAGELDAHFSDLILGTIAGGDTIFVALRDDANPADFRAKMELSIPKLA